MKIVSFANNNHGGLVNLKHSIQEGWELIVIGQGVTWEGWITRMKTIHQWLTNTAHTVNEVIVLCDAYDVLCLRSSDEFLSLFQSFQVPIVISAEQYCGGNCFPLTNWYKTHHVTHQSQKYCNAGLMCGEIGALKNLFQWLVENNCTDDQIGIGQYMDTIGLHDMELDVNNLLFYNDGYASTEYHFDKTDHQIIQKNNQIIRPFFIHFPGMNLYDSVTFYHFFHPGKMFEPGLNYNKLSKLVNDVHHIKLSVPNLKLYQISLWSERAIYFLLLFVLLFVCLYLLHRKHKKKHIAIGA